MCSKNCNRHLAFAVAVASFGAAFQHGYNTGVINVPQVHVSHWINNVFMRRYGETADESTVNWIFSVIVSTYAVGGLVGALMAAFIAEKFGRKMGLLLNNLLVFAAAVLMGFCKMVMSHEMLILGRFFIGINSGRASE